MSNLEFLRHHERISIQTALFKLVMWLELKQQRKIKNKVLRHSFWIASWKECWWLLFHWKYVTVLLSTCINTSQKNYEDPYIFHKSPNWLNRLYVMHTQIYFRLVVIMKNLLMENCLKGLRHVNLGSKQFSQTRNPPRTQREDIKWLSKMENKP